MRHTHTQSQEEMENQKEKEREKKICLKSFEVEVKRMLAESCPSLLSSLSNKKKEAKRAFCLLFFRLASRGTTAVHDP